MITVRDLQLMIEEAIHTGKIKRDSEVRFITKNNLGSHVDCSFIDRYATHAPDDPQHTGAPTDRRYGAGVFYLAQESEMQPAPMTPTLKQLDLIF